jgi:SAM-dependent methyltransferase
MGYGRAAGDIKQKYTLIELPMYIDTNWRKLCMNKSYWNNYYSHTPPPLEPSPFAVYVLPRLETGKNLIDVGCGNGRDSLFFSRNGLNVTAIDESEVAIESIKKQNGAIRAITDNFVDTAVFGTQNFDYAYSRFSVHAIAEDQEPRLLENIYRSLVAGGYLFIETRSVLDEFFGKGEAAGRNAYIHDDHYRRFIVMDELINSLSAAGFEITESGQNSGFAVYEDEDPIVIRVIARKP